MKKIKADLGPKRTTEVFLDTLEVGIRRVCRRTSRLRLWFAQAPDKLLRLAYRKLLADHRIEDTILEFGGESADRSTMALGQSPVGDRGLDTRSEIEQAQCVRDRRARAPHTGREPILGEPEFVDELAIGIGGFDRVEILALEVLDQSEFELMAIGKLANQSGDAIKTGRLGRPEAPLTSDELVAVDRLSHEDRLKDAVLGDARRERGKTVGIEPLTWLVRVGLDPRRRDLEGSWLSGVPLRDERSEAATESLGAIGSNRHDDATA